MKALNIILLTAILTGFFLPSVGAQGLLPPRTLPDIELPETPAIEINLGDIPETLEPGKVLNLLKRLIEIGENVSGIVQGVWGFVRSIVEQATGMDIREIGKSLLNVIIELLGVILKLFGAVASLL